MSTNLCAETTDLILRGTTYDDCGLQQFKNVYLPCVNTRIPTLHDIKPARFRGCCALAVVDAVIWKYSRPTEFSRVLSKPVKMY